MEEKEKVKVKEKKSLFLVIIGVVVVLMAAVIIGIIVMGNGEERKLQKQLDLGAKYLEEMNYEQALVAYRAAVEIDPRSTDAYIGMANAYVGMGDYDSAVTVLTQGLEQTGEEELADYLAEIQEAAERAQGQEIVQDYKQMQDYKQKDQELVAESEPRNEKVYNDDGSVVSYKYDARGNLERESWHNKDGEQLEYTRYEYYDDNLRSEDWYNTFGRFPTNVHYEYDKAGNLVKETWVNIYFDENLSASSDESHIVNYITYEYDAAGRLVKVNLHNVGGYTERYGDAWQDSDPIFQYNIYEYDESGNCIKGTRYNADGTMEGYSVNEYDISSNCIKSTRYNSGEGMEGYSVNEYDISGNCIKSIRYNSGEGMEGYSINEYDVAGKRVKEIYYNSDGMMTHSYEYNVATKHITWKYGGGDFDLSESSNEYDVEGEIIRRKITKETFYGVDGTVRRSNEYNAVGNEITHTYYNPDGTVLESTVYNWEQGQVRLR